MGSGGGGGNIPCWGCSCIGEAGWRIWYPLMAVLLRRGAIVCVKRWDEFSFCATVRDIWKVWEHGATTFQRIRTVAETSNFYLNKIYVEIDDVLIILKILILIGKLVGVIRCVPSVNPVRIRSRMHRMRDCQKLFLIMQEVILNPAAGETDWPASGPQARRLAHQVYSSRDSS